MNAVLDETRRHFTDGLIQRNRARIGHHHVPDQQPFESLTHAIGDVLEGLHLGFVEAGFVERGRM